MPIDRKMAKKILTEAGHENAYILCTYLEEEGLEEYLVWADSVLSGTPIPEPIPLWKHGIVSIVPFKTRKKEI